MNTNFDANTKYLAEEAQNRVNNMSLLVYEYVFFLCLSFAFICDQCSFLYRIWCWIYQMAQNEFMCNHHRAQLLLHSTEFMETRDEWFSCDTPYNGAREEKNWKWEKKTRMALGMAFKASSNKSRKIFYSKRHSILIAFVFNLFWTSSAYAISTDNIQAHQTTITHGYE